MKSTTLGLIGVTFVVLLATGCSPRGEQAKAPEGDAVGTPSAQQGRSAPEAPSTSPSPSDPPGDQPSAPAPREKDGTPTPGDGGARTMGKFLPPNVHIPPIEAAGTQNWKPAQISAPELGRRMDQAMAAFKGVYAEATLLLDVPAGKGDIHSKIEVFDPARFRYEYSLPETNVSPYIVIADGAHQAELDGRRSRWTQATPLSKPTRLKPGSPDVLVREFPDRFPRYLLDPVVRSTAAWESLLGAWASGKAGYRAVVEEKTMPVQGKQRLFYRVIAQKAADDTRVEVLLDAERLVPVTVRVEKRRPNGKMSQVQWQAKWSFSRKLDPKRLRIPTK